MALTNQTDYTAMKTALLAWSNGVLGANLTRWANTDFPRLAKPYATFEIVGMGADAGLDERKQVLNSGVIETTYIGTRQMVVRYRIHADAPGAFADTWAQELMQTALNVLQAQSTIDAFRAAGMAFLSHAPMRAGDVQEGDRWEWIAESDVTIGYRTELLDDGLADPPDDGQFIESTDITLNSEPTLTIDSTP